MEAEITALEYCLELLNVLLECPENKKCFDCTDTTSPRYVCTSFSTFVCSCCAFIHKEFGHSIKCMNAFVLTVDDICILKGADNKAAGEKWLARWIPDDCAEPDPTSPSYSEDARRYMRLKYIDKVWCGPDGAEPLNFLPQHDDKSTSPMFRASSYLSPQLVCNCTPQLYVPIPTSQCQYAYPQYPALMDAQATRIQPRNIPIPFQFVDCNLAAVHAELNLSPLLQITNCSSASTSPSCLSPVSSIDTSPVLQTTQLDHGSTSLIGDTRTIRVKGTTSIPLEKLARASTTIEARTSPPPQHLSRSASENVINSPHPTLSTCTSCPLDIKDTKKAANVRRKGKIQSIVNKMVSLLTLKKQPVS